MTDAQILTLVLTLLGIFAASWYNNSRFGDVSLRIADLNTRITEGNKMLLDRLNDTRDVLRAEMKAELAVVNNRFDRLEAKIDKMDDNIARLLADHENRISKLEGGKR